MAYIDDLSTELHALAAEIESTKNKNLCHVYVDQFIDALTAAGTSASTDVQSYSIMGRSVTRRSGAEASNTADKLMLKINRLLYGMTTAPDFSRNPSGGVSIL